MRKPHRHAAVGRSKHHRVPHRLDHIAARLGRQLTYQAMEGSRELGGALIPVQAGVFGVTTKVGKQKCRLRDALVIAPVYRD